MFHWLQNLKTLQNLSSLNCLRRSRRNADFRVPCLSPKPLDDWVPAYFVISYHRECNALVQENSFLVVKVNGFFGFRIYFYLKKMLNEDANMAPVVDLWEDT
jgi:hypothetical protein